MSASPAHCLLVPMNVQALVVNQAVLDNTGFQTSQMNYASLATFDSPAPGPFDNNATPPAQGVHLHWDLPAAFKHAPDANAANFPLVPNRWLVLRFWPGDTATPRQVKAWIVLSDRLTPAGNDGTYFVASTATYDAGTDTVTIPISDDAPGNAHGGGSLAVSYPYQSANPSAATFLVQNLGDVSGAFAVGSSFNVTGAANADTYSVTSAATYDSASDTVTIPVSPPPNSSEGGGNLHLLTRYAIHSANTDANTPSFTIQGYGNIAALFPGYSTNGESTSTLTVSGSNGSAFLYPSAVDEFPAGTPGLVGGSEILANWAGEDTAALPSFLRAIGVGDVSFAAFSPNVQNVFSFVDDATDQNGNPLIDPETADAQVSLSYLVAGWFSDASADPLQGASTAAAWAAQMANLKWIAPGSPCAIHSANPVAGCFTLQGFGNVTARFESGAAVTVAGSTGNDGTYTVTATAYAAPTDTTTISVSPPPQSALNGGYLVPAGAPETWPTTTLVHGSVNGVLWQNTLPARSSPSLTEIAQNVQVAFGNSSVDALAAMVSNGARQSAPSYPIASVETGAHAFTLSSTSDLSGTFPIGSLITVQNSGGLVVGSFHVASTTIDTGSSVFTLYTVEPLTGVQPGFKVIASDLDAELLEAFQYNLLSTIDEPDGTAQLDLKLRKPWFAHAPGGTLWSIVPTPREHTASPVAAPAASPAQLQWLAELNTAQASLDRETRVLHSLQDEFYTLWIKVAKINTGYRPGTWPVPPTRDGRTRPDPWPAEAWAITSALPSKAAAVTAQQALVASLQQTVDTLASQPPSYVASTGETGATPGETVGISTFANSSDTCPLTLKGSHLPRLYQPNDPVILVSGLNPTVDLSNPALVGQDFLPCRLVDDVVNALTVHTGNTITAAQVLPLATWPAVANLPAAIGALVQPLGVEALLLDPANAALLATIDSTVTADEIGGAIANGASFTGVAPAKLAVNAWQQSWIPLFIDWEVAWYPTVETTPIPAGSSWGPWSFDRRDWSFDGHDYVWQGGDVTAPGATSTLTFPIYAANSSAPASFTVRGDGDLSARFPVGAQFTVPAGSANAGTYTVASAFFADPDFVVVVTPTPPSSIVAAGDTIVLTVNLGYAVSAVEDGTPSVAYVGRTFLTPKATFDFRSRLQQYLATHRQSKNAPQLAAVEQLIDMIGGASYPIVGVAPATSSVTVSGQGDLTSLFPAGSTCYIADGSPINRVTNNGAYTVASTSFDATDGTFTVVVQPSPPVASNSGNLMPAPQQWDFLSQSLTGFTDQLMMRSLEPNAQPAGTIAPGLAAITGVVPAPTPRNRHQATYWSVTIASAEDLSAQFPAGSFCAIIDGTANNGVYAVQHASYDSTNHTLAVFFTQTLQEQRSGFGKLSWIALQTASTGGTTGEGYDVAALVGGRNRGVPDASVSDNAASSVPPCFFPVRGGFFGLQQLNIVDRFGQSIDLLYANGNVAGAVQTFAPIRSRWLTPAPAETNGWSSQTGAPAPLNLLKLPPRLAASSRLDFRFVSAPDVPDASNPADVDLEWVAGASPVCGWLLPNHLDQGLMVYDTAGDLLGEIILRLVPPAGTTIVWFPAPNSPAPVLSPAAIPNPHLREIVAGLFDLATGTGGDTSGLAFQNFLQAIDETLWTVEPLGGRSDQTMSALIGRPLAVVRARLRFMFDGHPAYDQTTTAANPNPRTFAIEAVDPAANSFSVANAPADLAPQFPAGGTLTVTGGSANDGSYHIVATTYSPTTQTFVVTVQEPVASDTATGSLVATRSTGGIESIPFSVRLGSVDLYNDGLIGYFADGDYGHFNNVHNPADYTSAGYLTPVGIDGNYLSLTPYTETTANGSRAPAPVPGSTFVTLLVDPRGSIHATTGILPTKDIALPPVYFEDALARMAVTFRTGPLLVDPQAIRLPRPSERHGRWSWIQKNAAASTGDAGWEEDPIVKQTAQARLPTTPLVLREGWMKLSPTDPQP